MAGYIGTKAVNLSTTGADITGDADVSGALDVGGAFTSQGIDDNANATAITIDSSENVGIGTSLPSDVLHVVTPTFGGMTLECTGATADPTFKFLGDSGNYWSLQQDASQGDSFQFRYNNSEKVRLDASGNLLINKTGLSGADSGFIFNPSTLSSGDNSYMFATNTRTDGTGYLFGMNRQGSNGDVIEFRRSNVKVGSIGVASDDIFFGNGPTSLKTYNTGNAIHPYNASSQTNRDNAIDLGMSSIRFDDIYVLSVISTSDRNEKQDIAELSDAEQRVAVAAKGLMRKFRWKNRVAEKGDDARIHCGIIAQDLQAAFVAEGLDAGDYAMFISTTWWETQTEVPAVEAVAEVLDEEGNVVTEAVEAVDAYTRTDTYDTQEEAPEGATERTRLGVRYSELLAFIIGAL
jgi:hypothetical protein